VEHRARAHRDATALRTAHTVKIHALDLALDLAEGEDLRTELSCKFRRDTLTAELKEGGFTVRHWWTDPAARFALVTGCHAVSVTPR